MIFKRKIRNIIAVVLSFSLILCSCGSSSSYSDAEKTAEEYEAIILEMQQEIDGLKKLGVKIECNIVIGKTLTIDELFDKMRSYDAAIVVCEETDMVLLDGAVAMESLELNGAEFRRISVEADAMTVFTDLLTYLEDIEAQYRAAVPEGDFTRCEIFMLTGAEN